MSRSKMWASGSTPIWKAEGGRGRCEGHWEVLSLGSEQDKINKRESVEGVHLQKGEEDNMKKKWCSSEVKQNGVAFLGDWSGIIRLE